MSNFVADDDLKAWITDLRARLERGEFTGAPPVDLGYGTGPLPTEVVIQVLLDDLARIIHEAISLGRPPDPDGSGIVRKAV